MVVVSSAFSAPAEGILLQQPSVKLLINDQELGTGTLFITEQNVTWGGGVLTAGGAAPTISLQYPTISLHAIQREPTPALYMVLNYELRLPELGIVGGSGDANEDDDDFDAEETPITQLRFLPQSENDLQPLYSAMSQGQALHPDPQDEVDDEDSYMDGEEFDEGDEEFEDAVERTPEDAAAEMSLLRLANSNGDSCQEEEDEAIGDNP